MAVKISLRALEGLKVDKLVSKAPEFNLEASKKYLEVASGAAAFKSKRRPSTASSVPPVF